MITQRSGYEDIGEDGSDSKRHSRDELNERNKVSTEYNNH